MATRASKKRSTRRISFSSLNSLIFFYTVLPLSVLMLVLTFGSISLHQDAMRNLVGERDQRTARSAASAIREQLNHRASAVHNITLRAQDGSPIEDILNSVDFLEKDFDVGICFYQPNGEQISCNGDQTELSAIEGMISQQVVELSQKIDLDPVFSEPFDADGSGEFFTIVLFGVVPSEPVVVGIFSITNLARETLSEIISSSDQGSVVLVDKEGQVLFQGGNQRLIENPSSHPGIKEALNGESGTTYFLTEDGEHVVAFSPVLPTRWALVIEETWDTVASPLLRYSETGSLTLVPIVIFALFALWFGTSKIIQPLSKLQQQSLSFSGGDFQAFQEPVGGIHEIRLLQATFTDMANQVHTTQQTLRKYLAMITDGQEDERRRLARELHDETLQSLIALNQRVMMVKRRAENAGLEDALGEIENLIGQSMQELRRVTGALRPIYLEDLGLVTALRTLTQEAAETKDIEIRFSVEGDEERLSDSLEIALFRVTQEAISNILRHSGATKANVTISFRTGQVELRITDNGIGFNPPSNLTELSNRGHFGLLGIYERAELIGGKLSMQSEVGQGSQLILIIPK